MVKEILQQVQDKRDTAFSVNVRNDKGESALYMATENGDINMVKTLLSCNGINVNAGKSISSWGLSFFKCCHENITPFFSAAFHGHLAILKELYQAKADINHINPTNPPLAISVAADRGHEESVKYLISLSGISVNDATLVDRALDKGNVKIAQILLGCKDIDPNGYDWFSGWGGISQSYSSPLIKAINLNNMEIFKQLLAHPKINPAKGTFTERCESDEDTNIHTREFESVLYYAILKLKYNFALEFLNHANFDKQAGKKYQIWRNGGKHVSGGWATTEYSTLDLAIYFNHELIIHKLLQAGVKQITPFETSSGSPCVIL